MRKIIFILLAVFLLGGCSKEETRIGYMKDIILKYENEELPTKLSRYNNDSEVTLEHVVFTNDETPYYGYIIATWRVKSESQDKMVCIPIYGVDTKGWNHKTVCWYTDWDTAHRYATKGPGDIE